MLEINLSSFNEMLSILEDFIYLYENEGYMNKSMVDLIDFTYTRSKKVIKNIKEKDI